MPNQPPPDPPVLDPNGELARFWPLPVWQLCSVDEELQRLDMSPERAERYTIFSLACMALVSDFWNGNKHDQSGDYPWRKQQFLGTHKIYDGGRYLGHNIACLAVDGDGQIIDFDFNHNEILSSSVEHAESRLVRRVFSLAEVWGDRALRRASDPPSSYATLLNKVTIFTTLESCAQCAGIMALAQVREVVFLQRDFGMYLIGNILRNLTPPQLRAPLPVPANRFGLPYYDQLNEEYRSFFARVTSAPFWKSDDGSVEDRAQSVTSFLCTDIARNIYRAAADHFDSMRLQYPTYKPVVVTDSVDAMADKPHILSNRAALRSARRFVQYAKDRGHRGTPHKL